MRIAVASEGTRITGHFGHCNHFLVYAAEEGTILREEAIPNPGHKPGFLPNFLADRGVNAIISGSMGGGALEIFKERGVEVITGASGDAGQAAENYLSGELHSTGSVCHEHEHHDTCKNE